MLITSDLLVAGLGLRLHRAEDRLWDAEQVQETVPGTQNEDLFHLANSNNNQAIVEPPKP